MNSNGPDRLYIAVRSDLPPGLQIAQSVHAAFHFFDEWPRLVRAWVTDSNFLVVVSVPNEEGLTVLAARATEEGIACTLVREPDLDDSLCAVALAPGGDSRRLCSRFPLALREKAMT